MNLEITSALVSNMPSIQTQISTAILSMNLDSIETMGNSMTKMLEQSVTPHLGNTIDIKL